MYDINININIHFEVEIFYRPYIFY